MKTLLFGAALMVATTVGCLSQPSTTTFDPDTGRIIERTATEQVAVLESEAAQLNATIDSLQTSAAFLPPPFDVVVLGILASLSAALERQRRKLKAEIAAAAAGTPPPPA